MAEFRNATSDRVVVAFAGADPHRALDRDDEDLAVADPAGLCRGGNRLDHAVGKRILHDHLELHLGKEVDDIFEIGRASCRERVYVLV